MNDSILHTNKRLSNLQIDVEDMVVKVDEEPTRFGLFIVTIYNGENELQVYMPKYISKHAEPGRRFIYKGLRKMRDGSDCKFHRVLWV